MHVYKCTWISIFSDLQDFSCIPRAWFISSSETLATGAAGVELPVQAELWSRKELGCGTDRPVGVLNRCHSRLLRSTTFSERFELLFYLCRWIPGPSEHRLNSNFPVRSTLANTAAVVGRRGPKQRARCTPRGGVHQWQLSFITDSCHS